MYLITKDNKILECVYETYDRWFEDLEWFVKSYYKYDILNDNFLDCLCAHLAYWNPTFEFSKHIENFNSIWEHIQSDRILNQMVKVEDGYVPEIQIGYFNGVSVYDQIRIENITYLEQKNNLKISLDSELELFLTKKEFEDLGGEIYSIANEDDFSTPFEYYNKGNVYIFQSKEDANLMNLYLKESILSLNEIYTKEGIKLISI